MILITSYSSNVNVLLDIYFASDLLNFLLMKRDFLKRHTFSILWTIVMMLPFICVMCPLCRVLANVFSSPFSLTSTDFLTAPFSRHWPLYWRIEWLIFSLHLLGLITALPDLTHCFLLFNVFVFTGFQDTFLHWLLTFYLTCSPWLAGLFLPLAFHFFCLLFCLIFSWHYSVSRL